MALQTYINVSKCDESFETMPYQAACYYNISKIHYSALDIINCRKTLRQFFNFVKKMLECESRLGLVLFIGEVEYFADLLNGGISLMNATGTKHNLENVT